MPNTREKLIEIMADIDCNAEYCKDCEFANDIDGCVRRQKEIIADHLIANGVTVQEWISVKDRLPDTKTDRWVDEDGSDYAYEVSEWLWGIDVNGTQVRVRFESGSVFEGWYDEAGKIYVITHWMPLPQPPKGE